MARLSWRWQSNPRLGKRNERLDGARVGQLRLQRRVRAKRPERQRDRPPRPGRQALVVELPGERLRGSQQQAGEVPRQAQGRTQAGSERFRVGLSRAVNFSLQVALVHYDHERLEATLRVPERRAAADATAHRRVPPPLRLLFTASLI